MKSKEVFSDMVLDPSALGFDVLAYGPFSADQIGVEYRATERNRWQGRVESHIAETWESYSSACRERGVRIYNGNLLRLDAHVREGARLLLKVSDVDFRTYVGTATSRFKAAFPETPQANPLAVCAVLVTADRRIIIERKATVDEYRGRYHVIGGFAERDVDLSSRHVDPFSVLRREVSEELGVPLLNSIECTGLIRTSMGSELCFSGFLDASFDDLLILKGKGRTDAEIDELLSLPDNTAAILSFLSEQNGNTVPSGRACLLLHGLHRHDAKWYGWAVDRLSRQ